MNIHRSVFLRIFIFIAICFCLISCATTVKNKFNTKPLASFEQKEKLLVAVIPVNNKTDEPLKAEAVSSLSGIIINGLKENGRYRVIEKERIDAIIAENKFALSGLVNSDTAKSFGNLLGADALCIVNISAISFSEKNNTILIAYVKKQLAEADFDARIVSIETGEVLSNGEAHSVAGSNTWVAFGFMKLGTLFGKDALTEKAITEGAKHIAYKLSETAVKK